MKKKLLLIGLLLSLTGCKTSIEKVVDVDEVSFKIQIEDTFTIKGRGTVIVGVIDKGTIKTGDTVLLVDTKGNSKSEKVVLGIEAYRKLLDEATKGDNVGILLKDTKQEEITKNDYLVIK